MPKQVFHFEEGSADKKALLGGKGANLAEMTRMGLPVPQGFTLTTEACMNYLNDEQRLTDRLKEEILTALHQLEEKTGKKLNDPVDPLLVSVRSGAAFSMPGMMDTILNLGLNDQTVEGLARKTGDSRFAYDCYRRLLQMFGDVVFCIDKSHFDQVLEYWKQKQNYKLDTDLTAEDWRQIVQMYKDIYQEVKHTPFPQKPHEQLFLAVEAVFRSWRNPRAQVYRNLNNIADDLGTAVNIQRMVFGNSGMNSGTGVAFTRNPSNGEKEVFGEFLLNAQGEDVVAGIRTPLPLTALKERIPAAYDQFLTTAALLEEHYRDMQDIEFTIEDGTLYFLQTRNGKRTAKAAFRVAVDLVKEGLITEREALNRIEPRMVDQLLHPVFAKQSLEEVEGIAKGLPASPGAASGAVYFTAEAAKEASASGQKVILLRQETSPEDIEGMVVSEAIVTSRGGMTSHAAVVARGMGTCCVVGCENLKVDEFLKVAHYNAGTIQEGDILSVDGSSGQLYLGEVAVESQEEDHTFQTLMGWADKYAKLTVRANAETPRDLAMALQLGAIGVGLARTEHMFFGPERLQAMRKLILAETTQERTAPLQELLQLQMKDFCEMFHQIGDRPIVIRLLDPPLHEFLPHANEEIRSLAEELGFSVNKLTKRIQALQETNPMLGHRGCRLAVTYPEIYSMQVTAIIKSALALQNEGIHVKPEIMIPLAGTLGELTLLKATLKQTITELLEAQQTNLTYTIGTMIELPRACIIADQLAEEADFFSFGTNDLTQMTYGFSRDDAAKYIQEYLTQGLLAADPFQTLDIEGVGSLMQMAVIKARSVRPDFKLGVCGEVGGDPASIAFFQQIGLDYVSCSPYRVPIARLAAAQAALSEEV